MAHIGLDLDNTVIDYDEAFALVGEKIGLLPRGHGLTSKVAVKDQLLVRDTGERDWMRLQGQVYGPWIDAAVPYDGAADFIQTMLGLGHRITIVSHKTRFGHFDETGTALWDAALTWLRRNRIVSDRPGGLAEDRIVFAETRDEKIRQIALRSCDLFIDDLPEVLLHPAFPATAARFWFAGRSKVAAAPPLEPFRDWMSLQAAVERFLEKIA